ncbi:MAG: hypothetical protein ACI4K9_07185 [Candidatus Fimenecus sp.]
MQNQGSNKKTGAQKNESLWKVFSDTFLRAEFLLLFFLLVYATVHLLQSENAFLGADGQLYAVPPVTPAPSTDTLLPAELPTAVETDALGPILSDPTVNLLQAPQTKGEIAAYYVAVLTHAKENAASVTLVQKKGTNYNGVVEAGNNPFLGSVAKSLMNSFLKEETPNTVYTTRADIYDNFIPRGTDCHLTESDLDEAYCSESGGIYTIFVKVKPDDNPQAGYGSGAVGSVITKEEIDSAVNGKVKLENVICRYDGAYSQIKVDKTTGNLLEIQSSLPMYLCLTAMGLDCRIGLQFDEYWTVQW